MRLLAVAVLAAGAVLAAAVPPGPITTALGPDDAPLVAGSTPARGWERLAPMQGQRTEATAVASEGKVWLLGGIFPVNVDTKPGRVDVFDPATGEWRAGPTLPLPLHHAPAVTLGTRIFVLGGFVGQPQFVPTATTWVLDTSLPQEEQSWKPYVPLPGPRGAHAAATDGARIWIFGGHGAHTALYNDVERLFLSSTAFVLDTTAERPEWREIAPFPDPRDHLGGAWIDGKVVAVGGRDLTLDRNTGRVDAYDPETDTWSRLANMPTPRGGIGVGALGGRLYVVGGEAPFAAFATMESYDPLANAWRAEPSLPEARHGVGMTVLDGALYVEAGGPTPAFSYSTTNYRYWP